VVGLGDFVDGIDPVDSVSKVIFVISVNRVHAGWQDFDDRFDRSDGKSGVNGVNRVILINAVIMALSGKFRSQLPAERLVQQRLLQRLQRRELAGVEGGEALGFFVVDLTRSTA
jgi:hypothetical protein